MQPTAADWNAVRRMLGCQHPEVCWWEGVVTVQYHNALGPKWRSCREHAAEFRSDDDYSVRDSGRPNRRFRPY